MDTVMRSAHIDPVCGMTVTAEKAAGSSSYAGTTYYFCGTGCLKRFEAAPESFLERAAPAQPLVVMRAPATRNAVPAPPGGNRLDHLGLIVREAADVDGWAAFLEQHGVTIDAKPRTHRDGARSCYFKDPDGNRVQIIHHPPISGKL